MELYKTLLNKYDKVRKEEFRLSDFSTNIVMCVGGGKCFDLFTLANAKKFGSSHSADEKD